MNNPIAKIIDQALSQCFDHHLEHSAPNLPEQVNVVTEENKFMDTLTAEQRAAYLKFSKSVAEYLAEATR